MKKTIRKCIANILLILICLHQCFSGVTVEASAYGALWDWISFRNVEWKIDRYYGENIANLSISSIQGDGTELVIPTKKELVEADTDRIVCGMKEEIIESVVFRCSIDDKEELKKVSGLVIHEDYPIFPGSSLSFTDSDPAIFQGNNTIDHILVNTNDKHGFKIKAKTFKDMSKLETVNIDAGTGEIQLDGSVFEGCINLENVTFTAGQININGGLNFSGCSKLKNVVFNGDVTFSGEKDFQGCNALEDVSFKKGATFSGNNTFPNLNLPKTNISFHGNATNISEGKSTVVFSECRGINAVSIGGKDVNSTEKLGSNFISNSTITNLNIESDTTLAEGAINNSKINGISFNATTKVGKGALKSCQVENMYFNTSDVKSSGNDGAIGKNSTVNIIYFNHYDFFRNSDKVTVLNQVPLGTGDYLLNCEKIFFLSPNFNKINQSLYDSKNETKVYGYGGTLSSYGDIDNITAKEMFEKWTAGSKNTYHNIVQLTSGQKQGMVETKRLFVERKDDKAVLDLSSLDVKAKFNAEIQDLDQLPTDEAGNVRQGEFELKYTKDPNAGTNFNYKVLTKATDEAANGQYAYTTKDGKYITCKEDKLELSVNENPEEPYRFYVQAAGEIWPLDVYVEQNAVKELGVSIADKGQKDGKIHLTVGDDLSKVKDQIIVQAIFADGKTTDKLDASQYTVVKPDLSRTPVTAQDTTLLVYHQDSRKSIELKDVQVHEKKLASFKVTCDKGNMPIGSQLTLDDVTLIDGIYENPLDTKIDKINTGYHFLQDGQETDVYTIKSGENKISVTYEGCVQEVAVTGVSNQVKDYEINCKVKEVELYQKSSLDISEVILEDVVYADERLDGLKVETVKSGFSFVVNGEETDNVELEDGENTIRLRYNGLDKKFTVKAYAQSIDRIEVSYCGPAVYEGNEVPKDTSVLLVTVYYKHPYEASVLLSNFEVSYETYHIIPGEDNEIYVNYKGVKSSKPIHVLGLTDGLKEIKTVEYRGSKEAGKSLNKEDFYVELGYLSGKTVTSEENPAILEKISLSSDKLTDGDNSIEVIYDDALTKEVKVSTGGQGDTEEPKVTTAPIEVPNETNSTQTPVPTTAPAITVAPGKVPDQAAVTQAPAGTASPTIMPTATELVQTQKDNRFMVRGVEYKVAGVAEKGGSVSVVSYDKKAAKVKLQTTVSFNGCQYKVTKIEKGAFKNCSNLSGTISLTKNVKVIEDSAFYGCKNINKVVFGDNVTRIGKSSFCNCRKLSLIQFKTGSVKEIGKNAFKGIAKKYKVKTTKMLQKSYVKRLKNAK